MDDPHEHAPQKPTSHRTAIFVLVAMFVTIAWFGWQVYRTSRLSIVAVSKAGEYRLKSSREHPNTLWIHVSGWVDGQSSIEIPGRAPAPLGPGIVEWKLGCDWFEPECVLKYAPGSVTSGRLEVEFRID